MNFSVTIGLGCRFKANYPLVGPGPIGGVSFVGVFLKDPSLYLRKFWRKTTENSEQLGRQARPGFEPGTSRLPALRAERLCYWWGVSLTKKSIFF